MKRMEIQVGNRCADALRCVEYRVPKCGTLTEHAYLLSLALRYGLVGTAAIYALFRDSRSDEDDQRILTAAASWADTVEEHLVQVMASKLPVHLGPNTPYNIARASAYIVNLAVDAHSNWRPLSVALLEGQRHFVKEFDRAITLKVPIWNRRGLRREFHAGAEMSRSFALNFYVRQQFNLEEVSAIAMLGE